MTSVGIGDKAPEFTALDDAERSISLTDFRGQVVVLYFYPKDDTAG
jgi:peroxiredoxin Q/BCP